MPLRDGGWWADADIFCRRPFRSKRDYVIASQSEKGGYEINNVLFVRTPDAEPMRRAVALCRGRAADLVHAENRPLLLERLVGEMGMSASVEPMRDPRVNDPMSIPAGGYLAGFVRGCDVPWPEAAGENAPSRRLAV